MILFDKSCKLRKQKVILGTFVIAFASGFVIANLLFSLIGSTTQELSNVPSIIEPQNEIVEDGEGDIRCKVQKLDPWDPSIKQWVQHPKTVECSQVQQYMTFMDDEGYLQLNETEVNNMNKEDSNFTCSYWTFDRNTGLDDESILYDSEVQLTNRTQLSKDSVEVQCKYGNGTAFYWNVYSYPVIREDLTFAKPTEDQFSVLFFLVDSVSNSAFQRNLPMSYNYTKNVMGIKFFSGFNKIGTNSYPNQMAMLTGKRMYWENNQMVRELPQDYDYYKQRFDSWPFIWKNFAAKGYATVFNSDWPSYGLFNYNAIGFTKKLFDYYYHWFWRRVDKLTVKNSDYYCFSNRPLPKINVDLTKNHIIKLKDTANFIFHALTETSHSGDNEIQRSDKTVYEFWKELYEGNYLNRTFVIFLSDHGIRLGDIRPTYVGAMEDRLPFYGLWFPQWFFDRYPHIKRNIESNVDRLTSSFDVYETMKDVANENFNGFQRQANSRGQSHLYPILKNRTCNSAGIADHWCACNKETHLKTNSEIITEEIAKFFVDNLNGILKDVKDLCQTIVFTKFNFLRKVQFNDEKQDSEDVANNKSKKTHYFASIETSPNNASFEAYVTGTLMNGNYTWDIKGGLDRSSRYGPYSDCMDSWWLSQFCPCYNNTKKSTEIV